MGMGRDHQGSLCNSLTTALARTGNTQRLKGASPEPNPCQWTQTNAAIQEAAVSRSPVKACVLLTSTGTRQSLDGSYLPIAVSE